MIQNLKDEFARISGSPVELKDFSIIIGAFSIILGIIQLDNQNQSIAIRILMFGILFLATGAFQPTALRFLYKIWMLIAYILGKIVTTALLFVVFFAIFIPTGFILRFIAHKDLLGSIENSAKSYWAIRGKYKKQPQDYKLQY